MLQCAPFADRMNGEQYETERRLARGAGRGRRIQDQARRPHDRRRRRAWRHAKQRPAPSPRRVRLTASRAAASRQQLKAAEGLVKVFSGMRGAAMKVGQTLSAVDLGLVPEEVRPQFQEILAQLQQSAEPVSFKAIAARHRGRPGRAPRRCLRRLRGGADRRRVDRPGAPGAAPRRPGGRREGPVPGHRRGDPRGHAEPAPRPEAAQRNRPGDRHGRDRRRDPRAHHGGARLRARGLQPPRDGARLQRPPVRRGPRRRDVALPRARAGQRVRPTAGASPRCWTCPQDERNRLGEILVRFYLNGPLRHRLLNGDPHPGNSLFLDDGRVAFVDFGFFKHLSDADVSQLCDSTRATYENDPQALLAVVTELGALPPDPALAEPFFEHYEAIFGWLMEDEPFTVDAANTADMMHRYTEMRGSGDFDSLTIPAEHFVLMRAVFLLIGLLGQLGATGTWLDVAASGCSAIRRARSWAARGGVLRRTVHLHHGGGGMSAISRRSDAASRGTDSQAAHIQAERTAGGDGAAGDWPLRRRRHRQGQPGRDIVRSRVGPRTIIVLRHPDYVDHVLHESPDSLQQVDRVRAAAGRARAQPLHRRGRVLAAPPHDAEPSDGKAARARHVRADARPDRDRSWRSSTTAAGAREIEMTGGDDRADPRRGRRRAVRPPLRRARPQHQARGDAAGFAAPRSRPGC